MIKICGITNQEDAAAAVEHGATAIGFNFYPPSPRYIDPAAAGAIETRGALRVGVFVNTPAAQILETAAAARLQVAQLHGDETPAGFPPGIAVWKAARVNAAFRFSAYEGCPAEALLLDGPAAELYGGAGKTFDWVLAAGAPWRIVIAGGLDAANVARAVALAKPWGVDACSSIERSPGQKDMDKMKAFLKAARKALQL